MFTEDEKKPLKMEERQNQAGYRDLHVYLYLFQHDDSDTYRKGKARHGTPTTI